MKIARSGEERMRTIKIAAISSTIVKCKAAVTTATLKFPTIISISAGFLEGRC